MSRQHPSVFRTANRWLFAAVVVGVPLSLMSGAVAFLHATTWGPAAAVVWIFLPWVFVGVALRLLFLLTRLHGECTRAQARAEEALVHAAAERAHAQAARDNARGAWLRAVQEEKRARGEG